MGIDASALGSVPLRFLGYGAAVAEAVQYKLSDLYATFQQVAAGYVLVHVLLTFLQSFSALAAIEVMLFHLLASIIIPTMLVQLVCGVTQDVLGRLNVGDTNLQGWVVVMAGLIAISICLSTVDPFVSSVLDSHIIPLLGQFIP